MRKYLKIQINLTMFDIMQIDGSKIIFVLGVAGASLLAAVSVFFALR